MANKGKHEVSNARTRLDATLQSLVDKKEDSYDDTAESDDDPDLPLPLSVQVVRSSGSPAASPSKRHSHRSKKRKRKDDGSGSSALTGSVLHTTYVMKLFDRSVDLARFDENTPLYPIARAWINSQSTQDTDTYREPANEDELAEDPSYPNVYNLPSPVQFKSEFLELHRDSRIPDLIPNTDHPLDIHADPDLGPPPEELLLRHMDRWKRIRASWCDAAKQNEMKYAESMSILKDIYERNLNFEN